MAKNTPLAQCQQCGKSLDILDRMFGNIHCPNCSQQLRNALPSYWTEEASTQRSLQQESRRQKVIYYDSKATS